MSKKVFLFGLITVSILITGCTKQEVSPESSNLFLESYNNIEKSYKLDESLNQCMENSLNKCMTSIVTSKARESMDESICDDLITEESIIKCKSDVILYKAVDEIDLEKCQQLEGDYFHRCIIDLKNIIAQNANDKNLCSDIIIKDTDEIEESTIDTYTYYKSLCIDNITLNQALNQQNTNLCDEISDEIIKEKCLEKILFELEREELIIPSNSSINTNRTFNEFSTD